jgi:glutamyl-tRNA synthetase
MGFPILIGWTTNERRFIRLQRKGFSEAVINALLALWVGMTERKKLFSLEECSSIFDLNRVHKSGAKFDPEKQMVQPSGI